MSSVRRTSILFTCVREDPFAGDDEAILGATVSRTTVAEAAALSFPAALTALIVSWLVPSVSVYAALHAVSASRLTFCTPLILIAVFAGFVPDTVTAAIFVGVAMEFNTGIAGVPVSSIKSPASADAMTLPALSFAPDTMILYEPSPVPAVNAYVPCHVFEFVQLPVI